MQTSVFLAKLIGRSLVLVAVGPLMNRKTMDALGQSDFGYAR
jgi:hypothetical protein